MIRKLQKRLIAVSMLSLLAVLTAIMGAANILNYQKILSDADRTLAILLENDGAFPQKPDPHPPREPWGRAMPPELPYESRYFSVRFSSSGEILAMDTGKIAAVDDQTAQEMARQIWDSGRRRGFSGEYRYVLDLQREEPLLIFLDCWKNRSTFRNFLLTSCGISLAGLAAVFLLILVFSRRLIRPVLESYEKQKQFITDAGHELKTPVTIIDADTEVLEMELGENEWLRDIQLQTRRLTSLTNDLIFLSRMEEDRPQLAKLPFSLSDLVSETAQSFQSLAKMQHKTFQIRVQPMLSLYGDEKTIGQLVTILLDNALKYSREEGDIFLQLEQQKKHLYLTVENSVDGPLPEKLDQLFQRFYRTDGSRSPQTGGYGLGLSIAKAIVEAHGGKISASSPQTGRLQIQAVFKAAGSEAGSAL